MKTSSRILRTATPYASFTALYVLIYGGHAIVSTFLPVYLNESGLTSYQIGIVFALGSLVAIFAQLGWGQAADKSRYKNTALQIIVGAACIISLLFMAKTGYAYDLFLYSFFMLFYASVFSINDSITLESIGGRYPFGRIRLGGTLGYALVSVLTGFIVKPGVKVIFPFFSLIFLAAFILLFAVPKVKGHQFRGRQPGNRQARVSFFQLFKNKELVFLLIYNLVIQITLGFYYSFFPLYFIKIGGPSSLLGISMLISSLSEVPFLLFADRMIKKIGFKSLLLISGLVAALRWGLFSLLDNPYAILAVQLLHCFMFAAMTMTMAIYINGHVSKSLRASGQTLNTITGLWLPRIIGSLAGGAISRVLGLNWIFACCSVICLAAAAVFWLNRNSFTSHSDEPEEIAAQLS
jgi:MFS transporter, PPP family, 3-phenylpropionic acid transporter